MVDLRPRSNAMSGAVADHVLKKDPSEPACPGRCVSRACPQLRLVLIDAPVERYRPHIFRPEVRPFLLQFREDVGAGVEADAWATLAALTRFLGRLKSRHGSVAVSLRMPHRGRPGHRPV